MMEFPQYSQNRTLIEIGGVNDERNDDDVDVAIYKGRDPLLKRGDEAFRPGLSQRVDGRIPPIARTRGRIDDGVLTIDPVPYARFTMRWKCQNRHPGLVRPAPQARAHRRRRNRPDGRLPGSRGTTG